MAHGSAEEFLHGAQPALAPQQQPRADDAQQYYPADFHGIGARRPRAGPIGDQDEWTAYWADECWALWTAVQETRHGYGLLDACTYPDFLEFCHKFSSGLPPRERRVH